MANNATLKDYTLVTAGYGEVFTKGINGPGEYKVRTCQPASGAGYEFDYGIVQVTQDDLDKMREEGHTILQVI